jgi:hypothetical protein
VADAIAGTLEAAVGALTSGQAHLDDSWLRLTRAVPGLRGFGFPVEVLALSATAGPAGDAVRAAIAEAHDIRDHVDGRLSGYATELGRHRLRLQAAMGTLALYVTPWLRPDELSSPGAILIDGDRIIVNGTGGADIINVRTDSDTDNLLVDVNGVVSRFPPGVKLVVRGGAATTGSPSTPDPAGHRPLRQHRHRTGASAPDITVLAGLGDDVVAAATATTRCTGWRATTSSGWGRFDYLSGGDDNGTSTAGTAGTSSPVAATTTSCTGWRRRPALGRRGQDYLDGGIGADLVAGGGGDDALVGGRGDDTVIGGDGDDRSTAATAPTGWPAGRTDDRAYVQPDDHASGSRSAPT